MMDNPKSAMCHHMAQEHGDIPTGESEPKPHCLVKCRRGGCAKYFQDAFIRDLHEEKECAGEECPGCKVSFKENIIPWVSERTSVGTIPSHFENPVPSRPAG